MSFLFFQPTNDIEKITLKKYPSFDESIVNIFCRIRLHGKIKYLNEKLKEKKALRGTRHFKQIGQFLV